MKKWNVNFEKQIEPLLSNFKALHIKPLLSNLLIINR